MFSIALAKFVVVIVVLALHHHAIEDLLLLYTYITVSFEATGDDDCRGH